MNAPKAVGYCALIVLIALYIVFAASITGLLTGLRWRTSLTWIKALSTAAIFAVLQLAVIPISFLPSIAKDR